MGISENIFSHNALGYEKEVYYLLCGSEVIKIDRLAPPPQKKTLFGSLIFSIIGKMHLFLF